MVSRFLCAAALLTLGAAAVSAQSADCVDGQAGDFECDGINLLSFISPQDLGAPAFGQCPRPYPQLCANDIWGWTDPETSRRYAIVGLPNGTAFVDVTDPTSPVRLGLLPTATQASSWRDVKAIGNIALVVSEAPGHGMQVFDLTKLRGLTSAPERRFTADARYLGFGSAHNVAVNEETNRAYAVGSSARGSSPAICLTGGLHAVDLTDPMNPAFLGCFSDADQDLDPYIAPGYTHDVQCVIYRGPDEDYQGEEICFAANEDVVTIFEVNDASDADIIAQMEYPNDGYTHQGWLTEDHRYFLGNDEFDELVAVNNGDPTPQRTLVFDVQDLDAPEFTFEYRSGLSTIDHNLYVLDGLAYQSNYESGLRVVDLAGLEDGVLEEVAFFDTYTPGTSVNFAGQWSNYPYFGDGLVIVNDGETGFFVLQMAQDQSTAIEDETAPGYVLSDPSPNPTSSKASAVLEVDAAQTVRAELFDIAGRRVAEVFDGLVAAGSPAVLEVTGDDLPAGVYVLRVTGETFEASKRVVLTR